MRNVLSVEVAIKILDCYAVKVRKKDRNDRRQRHEEPELLPGLRPSRLPYGFTIEGEPDPSHRLKIKSKRFVALSMLVRSMRNRDVSGI